MAALAFQIAVPARQRIVGLLRVIEMPAAPAVGSMAGPAFRIGSEPALMHSVLMAGLAGLWRILESRRAMTFRAGNGRMLPEQGEVGLVMIELDLLPVDLVVTRLAARPQLTLMRILLLVA